MTSKLTCTLMAILLALCNLSLNAQQLTPLAQKVQKTKQSSTDFQELSLFENAVSLSTYEKAQSVLAEGTLLDLKSSDLETLISTKPEALQMSLPRHGKSPLVIDLVQNEPLTETFRVVTQSSNGEAVDYTPGLYFHGVVQGSSKSVVAISFFDNKVMGTITTAEEGNMVLGKIEGNKGQYILYETSDLLVNNDFNCGTTDEDIEILPEDLKKMQDIANANFEKNLDNCVQVYVECEHDMYLENGSTTATVNFMTGLFNVVATLYNNEQITTQISEIFVWDTPDSYPTSSTPDALTAFRNARIGSINGDLGHLVSRGAPSNGGVAWVDALCTTYNFAYSWIQSSYSGFPTYNWSVEVFTHEMGHNLGSPHTHACAWNGNNTAIDGCGPASGNSEGCNASLPAKGTIMSYCHLVSGVGIDFNLGFGTQPGDLIRNEITNASCLSSCGPPCEMSITVTGTDANGGNNGTASVSVTGGTSPYSYSWSNGATTANISGLAPGDYNVTVTDDAGCVRTGSVTINDITPCGGEEVTLTIILDNYPEETSWDIRDSGGSVVASSNGTYGSEPDGSTVIEVSCLADGCYDFTIYDTFGDGICCAYGIGSYSLTDSGSNILASGGSFGSSETTNFCINPPPSISVSITSSSNPSCAGGSDGSATAAASGGSGSYTYAWSNGASGATASGLSAGSYTVTATDTGDGSTGTASVTINDPSAVTVSVSGTNASSGGSDGTATASASGGSGGYSYAWSNGGSGSTITGLAAGTYSVTATDSNGCTGTGSVVIEEDSGGGCTNVIVDSNDFESGWGIWNDGGSDCRRSANDNNYANGTYCVRLRDNTSTSVMTTDNLDLSNFEEVTVAFSYYPRSMDNSNEDFWLQISTNGGSSYTTVEEWNRGDEFENNNRYDDQVTVTGTFSSNTRIRFRCDASGNSDWIYIDDVVISGCTTGSGMIAPGEEDEDETVETNEDVENNITTFEEFSHLKLFPNPASTQLNVVHKVPATTENVQLVIMDFSGRVLHQVEVANGKQTTQIELNQFNPGYYLLQLVAGEERIVKRFVVVR